MPAENPLRRVNDLLAALGKIDAYVADIGGVEALMRDEFVHRDAVERQLLILSEAATKLRGQVEAHEPGIDWPAIRGMGNVIRHNYDGVEDAVVRHVITAELAPIREACLRLQMHFSRP